MLVSYAQSFSLLSINALSCKIIERPGLPVQCLTEKIRLLLSSYTKGIQKQQNVKGNLFQQKTKAKAVSDSARSYAFTAFNYIHQNPNRGVLCTGWKIGSFLLLLIIQAGVIEAYVIKRTCSTFTGFGYTKFL